MTQIEQDHGGRATLIIFVATIIFISIGAILVLASRPEPVTIVLNPPMPTATALPTATPAPITVYITGAVNQPEQLVTIPFGSRVQDAIDAAGGLTDDADKVRVNLAAILRDGDQVHVASLIIATTTSTQFEDTDTPQAPPPATTIALTSTPEPMDASINDNTATPLPQQSNTTVPATRDDNTNSDLISLNQATQSELEALPGIGPALAENIITYRDEIGGFSSIDELDDVNGIGEVLLEAIRPLVIIDAESYVLPDGVIRATIPPLATASGGDTIALNRATQAELETLPGIGPALAGRIIAYRDEIGQFSSLDELDDVSGIGEATLERLRPLLTLD